MVILLNRTIATVGVLLLLAFSAAIAHDDRRQADTLSPLTVEGTGSDTYRRAKRVERTSVEAKVDLSEQRMRVYVDGQLQHTWKVSTGRKDFVTPTGSYRPTWMAQNWKSRTYDNAPMPYSIFFVGGYAVHGTTAVAKLGKTASHGCVRLKVDNAKRLYRLVSKHGKKNSRITIIN